MITYPRIAGHDADSVAAHLEDFEIDAVVTEDRSFYYIESDDDGATAQAMSMITEARR